MMRKNIDFAKGDGEMQKNGSVILCTILLSMLISLNSGLVFAGDYTLDYWQLQKRTYENGTSNNRLGFMVLDEFGDPVDTDVVGSIVLVGTGVPDSLPAHTFGGTSETLFGRLDTATGVWIYDSDFIAENYYAVNFSGDLAAGFYGLTVIDEDGDPIANAQPSVYFNGVVALPEISSKSFRGFEDAAGNFLVQWDPPADTALWSTDLDVSIRCWLSIYDSADLTDLIAEVYVRIPAMVGGMYVPRSVMDLARTKGDYLQVGLHLRTNDNNNRYYTNVVPLNTLKMQRSGGGVVVVPLL
jgi:hypothetical protein